MPLSSRAAQKRLDTCVRRRRAVPGGIAARDNHGGAVPWSGDDEDELASLLDCWSLAAERASTGRCGRRQGARTARTLNASDTGRMALTVFVAALPGLAYLLTPNRRE